MVHTLLFFIWPCNSLNGLGVWDISLLIYYRIFNSGFFSFLHKSNHCLARTIHFAIPTLKVLQNLQKQLHEWLTSYTVEYYCCYFTRYTYLCILYILFFLFFTSIIIWKERERKRLVKVLKGWIPPRTGWILACAEKTRVLLNPVNLFVRMIIKFSYTTPEYFKRPLYLLGKRGKCRQPAPFLRNPLLWDFCKGFTLTVYEQ